MIRDLSEYEQKSIQSGACPFCGRDTATFNSRASGEMSTRYYCPCGAAFNLAVFQGKYVVAELIAAPEQKEDSAL